MSDYVALSVDGPQPVAPPEPSEGTAAAQPATICLQGDEADAYVSLLKRAVRAARLNAFFPPARVLGAHLGFLGPAGSRGLYDRLYISPRSGLPTAREVLRVKIDRDLAGEFLGEMEQRPEPSPASSLARRVAYYEALADSKVMPTNRMTVELRQVVPDQDLALLRVVLDRFDLAFEQFVRYTILLRQRDRFWHRRHVALERDLAAATEGFRRIVSRFASDEAEVAFVLLSSVEGIEVEDVRRCRVGPMLLPGVQRGPQIDALLEPREGPCAPSGPAPWVLCFPEDRAGIEVAANAGADPLAPLLRDAIAAPARELVDAKADELGYRVAKARKFVCPDPLTGPLRELCSELGAPSIVRALRE